MEDLTNKDLIAEAKSMTTNYVRKLTTARDGFKAKINNHSLKKAMGDGTGHSAAIDKSKKMIQTIDGKIAKGTARMKKYGMKPNWQEDNGYTAFEMAEKIVENIRTENYVDAEMLINNTLTEMAEDCVDDMQNEMFGLTEQDSEIEESDETDNPDEVVEEETDVEEEGSTDG